MTVLTILGMTALNALAATAILSICVLVGLRILPAAWLRGQGWHDLPVALSAGSTATGVIMWTIATVAGTWEALAAFGILAIVSLRMVPRAWRLVIPLSRRITALARHNLVLAALLLATLLLLVPQLALPPMASDAVRYHLAEPKLALLTGKLSFDPYNLKSGLPQTTEMLYLIGIAAHDGAIAKCIHGEFFALTLLVLILTVHRRRRLRRAAWLAPLLFAWSPVVLTPAGSAFIDHAALFHLAVAMLLLTRRGRPELTGIAFAGALASKLTTAPAVILLGLAALMQAGRRGWARALFRMSVPVIVVMAPLAIRNLILTGDPIFPVGHVLLGRPIAGVSRSGLLLDTEFHGTIHTPLGIGWSSHLWPVQPDEAAGLQHLLLGFVAMLIAVRQKWIRPLLAPIFAYIAVGLVLHTSARFDFPMFWAMAVFEAVTLELWIGTLGVAAGILAALPAGIAAVSIVLSAFSPMAYLEGRVSRAQLLCRDVPGYAAAQRANTLIHDGWIMALDFPAPYYLDHPWIAESVEEMPPLERWMRAGMTASQILTKLRGMHVRLILMTPGYGGGTPFSMLPLASTRAEQTQVLKLRRRLKLIRSVRGVDIWAVPPFGALRLRAKILRNKEGVALPGRVTRIARSDGGRFGFTPRNGRTCKFFPRRQAK